MGVVGQARHPGPRFAFASAATMLALVCAGGLVEAPAAWPAPKLRMSTARKAAAQRTLELAQLVARGTPQADSVTGHGVQSCRRVSRTRVRCKTWSRTAYAGRYTYCGYQVEVRRLRRGVSTRISQRGGCALRR